MNGKTYYLVCKKPNDNNNSHTVKNKIDDEVNMFREIKNIYLFQKDLVYWIV